MGVKDISDNLLNKGEHAKEQVKPSELSSMESEFSEITTKLEQERQTREGLGRLMKHPLEVITEKPENILFVCLPIGLLFFLIPGIIAYAVDFSEGTIYLPGGLHVSSPDLKNIKQVKFDPKHATLASIEKIIQDETGQAVTFGQPGMRVIKLKSTEDMMLQFAQTAPEVRDDRLSLAY